MTKKIYLETLKSVLGCSIFYYSLGRKNLLFQFMKTTKIFKDFVKDCYIFVCMPNE